MSKVAYIFGAGASAHCLPTVSKIPYSIENLIKNISQFDFTGNVIISPEYFEKFINHMISLKEKASSHATIDTYAKKLYITGKSKEYRILKSLMSAYFTLEQIRNKTDPRYEAFYAALLDDSMKLPDKVTILSWNYDFQFEKALCEFMDIQSLDHSGIPRYSKGCIYSTRIKPKLIKINGSASYYNSRDEELFLASQHHELNKYVISDVLTYYDSMSRSDREIRNLLSFAWEDNSKELYEVITDTISEVTTLVVIGYSFPFFNRKVDRAILESMPNLKKVYFQDCFPERIMTSFMAITNKNIEKIPVQVDPDNEYDQFFLPPEL